MKFLCLAYGDKTGWDTLSETEKEEVLANDKLIRDRGNLMSSAWTNVATVKNWDKKLEITDQPFCALELPLAGFSVIEAETLDEVIKLVADTPCARARGAIEIRPLRNM